MHQVGQLLYWVLLVLGFASIGFSQSLQAPAPQQDVTGVPRMWGAEVGIESSGNVYSASDPEGQRGLDVQLVGTYRPSEKETISGQLVLSQALVGPERNDIQSSDARFTYTRVNVFRLPTQTKGDLQASIVVPASETSRETDRLYGGVGGGFQLRQDWGPTKLSYRLRIDRYFHEFNLDEDGNSNNQHVLSHRLGVDHALFSVFSLSLSANFNTAWSYRNFVRERFDFSQDLAAQINPRISLWIGHTNGGPAFKQRGRESNFSFTSASGSTFRMGLGATL